ncbi:type 1 glutamine amidotransferase family protein [Marinimicrobium alkaliphilum]|uniref:hypothetical protein n=1 Tax=Marinimicrobium alkaliphilum TaxID=2202654 RepID=UPI000DBAC71B|nr:hypothetical protein [Marinimicrobium alkaliphilum]
MSEKYKKSTTIRRLSAIASVLLVFSLLGCGGSSTERAERLEVSSEPASEQDCPAGGSELTFGYDTNADGTIDELSHVEVICSGEAGPGGEAGQPLLVVTEAATFDECAYGGVTYAFGYDTDGDGEMDDAQGVETVCNGSDGERGLPMLLETANVGVDVCENGKGTTYSFGYDTVDDGQIDDVVSEKTICVELTSEAVVSGASVLYWADGISSDAEGDVFLAGLEVLYGSGFIELTVATDGPDLLHEVESGEYDVIVLFAQSNPLSSNYHDPIVDWVENDGRLIFGTYTESSDDGLFAALETTVSGSANHDTISFTSPRSRYGLSPELALFTLPWNTHSLGLEPLGDGVSICQFDDGDSCAVLGNEGRTLQVGVLSDVFPAEEGDQIVVNLLATLLESGF